MLCTKIYFPFFTYYNLKFLSGEIVDDSEDSSEEEEEELNDEDEDDETVKQISEVMLK